MTTVRGTTLALSAAPICLIWSYRHTMPSTFMSWRLYSWMRFTWMSSRAPGAPRTPVNSSTRASARALATAFTSRQRAQKAGSAALALRPSSWARSVIQASEPSVSEMSARSGGLQKASHRRGVTPFVLFWNLAGHRSAKSLKMVSRMMSEWMAATPLTVCDATTAR